MPQTLFLKPFVSVPVNNWSFVFLLSPLFPCVFMKTNVHTTCIDVNIKVHRRVSGVVCMGMLAPRKLLQKRKKQDVFRDAADEADQKNWRRLMSEIEEIGSAVAVLKCERMKNREIPKDLVLGNLVRFKQLKKWKLVSQILEWLRTQTWWNFGEMDYLMFVTAYGKRGDFNSAEKVSSLMTKKGYAPSVVSHTALMEAYGRGGRYRNAEAIFRRMKSSGLEPSALTYQIILKTFVEGCKFREAEEIFETLLNDKKPPWKPVKRCST